MTPNGIFTRKQTKNKAVAGPASATASRSETLKTLFQEIHGYTRRKDKPKGPLLPTALPERWRRIGGRGPDRHARDILLWHSTIRFRCLNPQNSAALRRLQ